LHSTQVILALFISVIEEGFCKVHNIECLDSGTFVKPIRNVLHPHKYLVAPLWEDANYHIIFLFIITTHRFVQLGCRERICLGLAVIERVKVLKRSLIENLLLSLTRGTVCQVDNLEMIS